MPIVQPPASSGGSGSTEQQINGFRLSKTNGVVFEGGSTTTLWLTPYVHASIGLWNGSAWSILTSSAVSLTIPTQAVSNAPYDVYAYNNAGSLAIEALSWTNNTTRATSITLQDGVYCKSSDKTRRYVGSFGYSNFSIRTELEGYDNQGLEMLLYNQYNQVPWVVSRTRSASYTQSVSTNGLIFGDQSMSPVILTAGWVVPVRAVIKCVVNCATANSPTYVGCGFMAASTPGNVASIPDASTPTSSFKNAIAQSSDANMNETMAFSVGASSQGAVYYRPVVTLKNPAGSSITIPSYGFQIDVTVWI